MTPATHSSPRLDRRRIGTVAPIMAVALLVSVPVRAQLDLSGGELLRQGVAPLDGSGQVDDRLGSALAAGDFDHDGRADLAIGVPRETVGFADDGGIVAVVYGTATGLGEGAVEEWNADDFSALGFAAETGDRFGSALAAGDFDDDGYDDLAIGAPQKLVTSANLSTHAAAGVVFVLYGGPGGLSTAGQQAWHQERNGLSGAAEENDRLGEVLAVGDADGDGYADLAIGVPYEDVGTTVDAGGVNLLYGSATGLSATSHVNLVWTQATFGAAAETDDHFGAALAFGDFADDGADDLAIGSPDENLTGAAGGGLVIVAQGLPGSGLATGDEQTWTQGDILLPTEAEAGERFGAALAAADFDGDGVDDLAFGSPGELWVSGEIELSQVGAVDLLRGAAGDGLGGNGFGVRIDRAEVGTAAALDSFGSALAAGFVDADGAAELAIGAPGATVDGLAGAGAVYLVPRPFEAPLTAFDVVTQSGALPGTPTAYDNLGTTVVLADFDGNRFADLAAGAPFEDAPGPIGNAGAVSVVFALGLFRDDFETGTTSLWSGAVQN